MTHAIPPHPQSHATANSGFSDEMIREFRKDDTAAATAIVCLMAGIFVLGLVLYLCVCYTVS